MKRDWEGKAATSSRTPFLSDMIIFAVVFLLLVGLGFLIRYGIKHVAAATAPPSLAVSPHLGEHGGSKQKELALQPLDSSYTPLLQVGGRATDGGTPLSDVPSEQQYLNLTEDETDIALGCLTIEREIRPQVDIRSCIAQIDAMAADLQRDLEGLSSARQVVDVLNYYVFFRRRVRPAETHEYLSQVLEQLRGNCTGLTCLYLSLAERLHIPLHGVCVPGHVFVRYDDGTTAINVETTAWGHTISDDDYSRKYHLSTAARGRSYLKSLSKRQFLATILLNRSETKRASGQLREALRDLNAAISLDQESAPLYNNRGSLYAELGAVDEGIRDATKAITLDPWHDAAHHNRGLMYQGGGQFEKAIVDFTAAIAINDKRAAYYNARGLAYMQLRSAKQAEADISKAIQLDPTDSEAHYNLGVACLGLGHTDKAIQSFDQALAMNPTDSRTYFIRGVVYANLDREKMIDDLRKAIALDHGVLSQVRRNPVFERYQNDREFVDMLTDGNAQFDGR